MRVVIDTNVLLISLPVKSPYRSIFDAILMIINLLIVLLLEMLDSLPLKINIWVFDKFCDKDFIFFQNVINQSPLFYKSFYPQIEVVKYKSLPLNVGSDKSLLFFH